MGAAKSLTKSSFTDTTKSGVTLVDFWAEWCGPCKAIAPIIDQLATEYEGKATVGKVNVDEDQELAQDHGVQSIPTILVIKDGKEINRFIGVKPKAALAEALNSAIS